MLSRVAENIYWMARYIERAENISRILDVNNNLLLDMPVTPEKQWRALIAITGDEEPFDKRYKVASEENVVRFLVCDSQNWNSILSCVRMARENARSVREVIPSEVWLQLNTLYLLVRDAAERGPAAVTGELYAKVRLGSHLFFGLMADTMTHNEAYRFAQLGRFIERADKTSRVVDVNYFLLDSNKKDHISQQFEGLLWMAVLKSVSAYEMYWKEMTKIEPKQVVQFLLNEADFPRSIRYCVRRACIALNEIVSPIPGGTEMPVVRRLIELRDELEATAIEKFSAGPHEFIDNLQGGLNQLHSDIHEAFFSVKPTGSEDEEEPVEATQSQSQSG